MRKNKGFTLIEMLMVGLIMSIISLGLYVTLNSGIKVWQRINNQQLAAEDVNIFFDKFASDLRNSLPFTAINFTGTENGLSFASIIKSQRMQGRTIGQVLYRYDSQAGILDRRQKDYSQIYNAEETAPGAALKNIKSLVFRYYVYDKERKEYFWHNEPLPEQTPWAVRLELEFLDGAKRYGFSKTVAIPVNG
jgi:prepilin-type N-terminal cleavage/methylation domain-containing protein